ncbi:hypothetical protein [Providencia rettgeri]|uniref:hypothetical protein n=1 Tax=Providencia rettgeri TaxID=587 RepID=UPI0034E0BBEA
MEKITMGNLKILVLLLISLVTSGCINKKEKNKLTYTVEDAHVVLNNECILELQQYNSQSDTQQIWLKLKETPSCSGKLNALLLNNIGKHLSVQFGGETLLSDTYISSGIRSEDGFIQSVPNNEIALKIINAYK